MNVSPFPPRCEGPFSMQLEDVRPIAVELAAISACFARETADDIPWKPFDEVELVRQQAAGLMAFTVRHLGDLVGVCFARLFRDGAVDGGMYLEPSMRGGMTSVHLARYVQQTVAAMGARWMVWDCQEGTGSEALAKRLRLKPISRRYVAHLSLETAP